MVIFSIEKYKGQHKFKLLFVNYFNKVITLDNTLDSKASELFSSSESHAGNGGAYGWAVFWQKGFMTNGKFSHFSTVVLNGGSGGWYPKSGPELNFNSSGAS